MAPRVSVTAPALRSMTTESATSAFDPAKVAALIPCYQEADHIGGIVTRVRRQLQHVLVIDDGSTDGTGAKAAEAGAETIVHPKNAGKGAAIKTGLRSLLERGVEYALILDGDGQHLPEEIDRFLTAAARESAGIILGNRMHDTREMPLARKWTNRVISALISRLCHQAIPDTQCGFRMIHRAVIPSLFCECNAYDYETEMILIASRAGYRIATVPISTIYGDEKSKIHPVLDGIRFVKLILRYRGKALPAD